MSLDTLEAEVAGPMRVSHLGQVVVLSSAADLHWKQVMASVAHPSVFGSFVWPYAVKLPYRDLLRVQEAWRKHNGLPQAEQCRRLGYMMERYSAGVEYDLRNHLNVSSGELWRQRRWRELLSYIDMLPTNSHMNRLLTSDEEYMELALSRQKETEGPVRPSMAEFSLTNSLLMQVIDAVHVNTAVNKGIANPKKPMPKVEPVARPYTAAETVRRRIERKKHEEMVAMLLPHKRNDSV